LEAEGYFEGEYMKDKGWHHVYPVYLDSSKARSEGRRVARGLAVDKPRVEEILQAAKELGLEAKVELDVKYPRSWWADKGRVLVKKTMPKTRLLNMLASKLKELRSRSR